MNVRYTSYSARLNYFHKNNIPIPTGTIKQRRWAVNIKYDFCKQIAVDNTIWQNPHSVDLIHVILNCDSSGWLIVNRDNLWTAAEEVLEENNIPDLPI